jgi:hypothetical protein
LLTNLVNYSHTGGEGTSNPLPSGYAPMTDGLYQTAMADIAKDVLEPGGASASATAAASSSSSSSSTSGGSSGTGAASHPSSGSAGARGSANGGAASHGGGSGGANSNTSASSGGQSSGGGLVGGHEIEVSVANSRYFVPGLLILALLCLAAGPLLYLSPKWRKGAAGTGPDAAGASGPDGSG